MTDFILRDYQHESVEAGLDSLAAGEDSLLVLPTGGGKSGVAGTIKKRLFNEFDGLRIINVTHVAELVDQNFKELIGFWEWAPAGVYSAGLGRRDMNARILFAGIQSIHAKAAKLGQVDVMMVDEAHLIPRNADTMYGRFIAEVRDRNPDMRLLGLTATPYRTDSGRLDEETVNRAGEVTPPLFSKIAHEVGIGRLIDEGYLTRLVTKRTKTGIEVGGVAKRGGDFVPGQLQAAVDLDSITRPIVDEIVEYGQDRKSWLVFCAGVQHAHNVAAEIRRRGFSCGTITGDTPPGERAKLIADFKGGRLRALTNASVLTTGFNAPGVDLLAMIRPTESTGLYVQICGRGTRTVYAPGFDLSTREGRLDAIAAGPKPTCLVLDFAKNIQRHGPIDMVKPKKPGKGGGEAPTKECPKCNSEVPISVMTCPDCGHIWIAQLSEKITPKAATAPILSKSEPIWVDVTKRSFSRHEKFGSAPSMRVDYMCGVVPHKEWVPCENPKGVGLTKSWWKSHGGLEPAPTDVSEALSRAGELRPVSELRVEADGRYWRITGRRLTPRGEVGPPDETLAPPPFTQLRYDQKAELAAHDYDDDIPF